MEKHFEVQKKSNRKTQLVILFGFFFSFQAFSVKSGNATFLELHLFPLEGGG